MKYIFILIILFLFSCASGEIKEGKTTDNSPTSKTSDEVKLIIDSKIPEAYFRIDDQEINLVKFPITRIITKGIHEIQAKTSGYLLYKEKINVEDNATINIKLEQDTKEKTELEIISDPSEAIVYLGVEELGKTPLKTMVPKGEFQLEFSKPGYKLTKSYQVQGNKTIDEKLIPIEKIINIHIENLCSIAGLIIQINDGKSKGLIKSDYNSELDNGDCEYSIFLPVGDYSISIKHSAIETEEIYLMDHVSPEDLGKSFNYKFTLEDRKYMDNLQKEIKNNDLFTNDIINKKRWVSLGNHSIKSLEIALKHSNPYIQSYASLLVSLQKDGIDLLPKLKENLYHNDDLVKLYAIKGIKYFNEKANHLISDIQNFAKHKNPALRGTTFSCLGSIGTENEIPILKEGLNDEDSNNKFLAALSLGNIKHQEAFDILLIELKSSDLQKKKNALYGLSISNNGLKAEKEILSLLNNFNEGIVTASIYTLGKLKSKKAVPFLINFLHKGKYTKEVSNALVNIGKPSVPDLIKVTKNSDSNIRYNAVLMLGRIGKDAEPAVQSLIDRLKDSDEKVSKEAKNSIINIGKDSIPKLVNALERANTQYDMNLIIEVLKECKGSSSDIALALPTVIKKMKLYKAKKINRNTFINLSDIIDKASDKAESVLPSLKEFILEDDNLFLTSTLFYIGEKSIPTINSILEKTHQYYVQYKLIQTLGRFGKASKKSLDILKKLLNSPSNMVKEASIDTLANIGKDSSHLTPTIINLYNTGDNNIIESIDKYLYKTGKWAVPYIIKRLESEKDPLLITLLINSLGNIGQDSKEAVPQLIKLFKNSEDDLRINISIVLGKIGKDAESALDVLKEAKDNSNDSYLPVFSKNAINTISIDQNNTKKSINTFWAGGLVLRPISDSYYNWEEANNYCKASGSRLVNIKELIAINNSSHPNIINEKGSIWSSTEESKDFAIYLNPGDGKNNNNNKKMHRKSICTTGEPDLLNELSDYEILDVYINNKWYYILATKKDEYTYYTDPDKTKYIKKDLFLIVRTGDFYHEFKVIKIDSLHIGHGTIARFFNKKIQIFVNYKTENNTYSMHGMNYWINSDTFKVTKSPLFENQNWGFFPKINENGSVDHFSFNGYLRCLNDECNESVAPKVMQDEFIQYQKSKSFDLMPDSNKYRLRHKISRFLVPSVG